MGGWEFDEPGISCVEDHDGLTLELPGQLRWAQIVALLLLPLFLVFPLLLWIYPLVFGARPATTLRLTDARLTVRQAGWLRDREASWALTELDRLRAVEGVLLIGGPPPWRILMQREDAMWLAGRISAARARARALPEAPPELAGLAARAQ